MEAWQMTKRDYYNPQERFVGYYDRLQNIEFDLLDIEKELRPKSKRTLDAILANPFDEQLSAVNSYERVQQELTDKMKIYETVDHEKVVKRAVKEGKNVPIEVLRDYPDIQDEITIDEWMKRLDKNKEKMPSVTKSYLYSQLGRKVLPQVRPQEYLQVGQLYYAAHNDMPSRYKITVEEFNQYIAELKQQGKFIKSEYRSYVGVLTDLKGKLKPSGVAKNIPGLTSKDYDRAIDILLEAHKQIGGKVKIGGVEWGKIEEGIRNAFANQSTEMDAFVVGIKDYLQGKKAPSDPNLGGSFASGIIRGFGIAVLTEEKGKTRSKKKARPLPDDALNVSVLRFDDELFQCYGKQTKRGYRAYCRRGENNGYK